jgi:hypothetical protein
METSVTKWKCIIKLVITNGNFEHHHNEPTCKDKWGSLYGKYKKIHDMWVVRIITKNIKKCLLKTKPCKVFLNTFVKCTLSSLTHSWATNLASLYHIHKVTWIQMILCVQFTTLPWFFTMWWLWVHWKTE